MQATTYHSLLRISAVVFAFILLFDSGLLTPATKAVSLQTQSYVANVIGVTAGVEPNELNTITAELTQQKVALEAREQVLATREIAVARNSEVTNEPFDYSTFVISIILFILLVLILLNYGLDFARMQRKLVLNEKTT